MHLLWQNKGNLRDITVAYTQHPSTSFQRTCFPESLRNCPSGNVASEKCITRCWDPFKCWILPLLFTLSAERIIHPACKRENAPVCLTFHRPCVRESVSAFMERPSASLWRFLLHWLSVSRFFLTPPVLSHIQSSARPSSIYRSNTSPTGPLPLSLL